MDGKTHTCVRFCLNGPYTVEHIQDNALRRHIEYNTTFRFGQFLFVDGEYAGGGTLKQPHKDKFIKKCKARIAELGL